MTLIAFKRLEGMKNAEDSSREFVIIIVYISVISRALFGLLVYKGSNNDLQSFWVKDVIKESNTYFINIENG